MDRHNGVGRDADNVPQVRVQNNREAAVAVIFDSEWEDEREDDIGGVQAVHAGREGPELYLHSLIIRLQEDHGKHKEDEREEVWRQQKGLHAYELQCNAPLLVLADAAHQYSGWDFGLKGPGRRQLRGKRFNGLWKALLVRQSQGPGLQMEQWGRSQ